MYYYKKVYKNFMALFIESIHIKDSIIFFLYNFILVPKKLSMVILKSIYECTKSLCRILI